MTPETNSPPTEPAGDNDQAQQAADAKNAMNPGEMLRRARESLNLTISDLAGQTRLSRSVLEALEKNDFASLAMPVYVRGYFRKCAHVLNVPEDRLLNAYAEWTGTPLTPQPLPVTINEPPEEYVSSERAPSWRYALIAAVVLGAVLWWFGSGDGTPPPAATDNGVTTLALEPKAEATEPAAGPPESVSDGHAGEIQAEGGTEAGTADRGLLSALLPSASRTDEAAAEAPADEPEEALPPLGPDTLQIRITGTSWVEVYDDQDRRLVYGLLEPGTEQRVTGELPYKVTLGHPQGVQLSLGGKAIDLERHTRRDGTARLRIREP